MLLAAVVILDRRPARGRVAFRSECSGQFELATICHERHTFNKLAFVWCHHWSVRRKEELMNETGGSLHIIRVSLHSRPHQLAHPTSYAPPTRPSDEREERASECSGVEESERGTERGTCTPNVAL